MKITINDRPLECAEAITLETLLTDINRLQAGTALAVNNTIVHRHDWSTWQINAGDQILLFQAIAGG